MTTAYALFIVLAISAVLAGIAGVAYIALLGGGFSGRSLNGGSFFHKRSIGDGEEADLAEEHLIRVMILIAEMEEVLRRSGLRGEQAKSCKMLRVCQLAGGQVEGKDLTPKFGVEHLDAGRDMISLLDNGR